jgi:C4-dicarboxylate transporter
LFPKNDSATFQFITWVNNSSSTTGVTSTILGSSTMGATNAVKNTFSSTTGVTSTILGSSTRGATNVVKNTFSSATICSFFSS